MVAGTNKTSKALNIEDTTSPTPIPISVPLTLSIPNLLTITNTVPERRNVWLSLPLTFMKLPTSMPRSTSKPNIWALYCSSAGMGIREVNRPTAMAKIIPIRKAHAPTLFSFDFIANF